MKKLEPLDFYLLRIPAFPLEKLLEINKVTELENSKQRREKLRLFFSEKHFKKAIYLSSIQLYDTLEEWLINDNLEIKKEEKLIKTLHKYYTRICTRATPYGAFAGFAMGDISINKSDVDLINKRFNFHCRADTAFTESLKRQAFKEIDFNKQKLFLSPNNSLYSIKQKVRYINFDLINNQIKYKLSEVETSGLLEAVLEKSKNGIFYCELLSFLEENVDQVESNILEKYIDDLIGSKILMDNLSTKLTDYQDPILQLKDKLESPVAKKITWPLENYIRQENGKNSLDLKKLQDLNKTYKTKVEEEFNQVIQVDLEFETNHNNLNTQVVEEIISDCEVLKGLEKRKTPKDLIDFRNKFLEKFGDKEVPLNVAIDFNTGIGYGAQTNGNIEETPLLDNINYSIGNSPDDKKVNFNKFILIQDKLKDFYQNDVDHIALNREDIKKLSFENIKTEDNVSDFYLMGKILSKSFSEMDNGNYKFLPSGEIPSPHMPNLLSRFASNNSALESKIRDYTISFSGEASPDVITCEIIHQPDERLGNILLRPSFYEYEIPYISQSSSKKDNQINVSDILVYVVENRIVLKSKRLQKEIIPKLSSAHNFGIEGLPTFRFLCDLQYQKVNTGFLWDWDIYSELDFLPRIEYNKIILSPAQWKLKKDPNINIKSIERVLKNRQINRYCYFASGDNELVLDLQNSLCLTHLIDKLKKGNVKLYEYLALPGSSPLKAGNVHYSSEVILPLRSIVNEYNSSHKQFPGSSLNIPSKIKRTYYPGEDWVYFKIYTSNLVADEILINNLKKFSETKIKSKEVSKWFFLRYNDPENHLRVRFKVSEPGSLNIIKEMTQEMSEIREGGLVNKITVDTYEREIERYGAGNIDESESLFFHDSVAVVDSLALMKIYGDEITRWKVALISINLLLNDFNFSLEQKKGLLEEMSNNFFQEFTDLTSPSSSRKKLKFSLDQKYRDDSSFLEDVIINEIPKDDFSKFLKPFKERAVKSEKVIEKLKKENSDEKIRDLLYSYIHMSMNRFFNSKPRVHELIIYYFLKKIYTSFLMRNKKIE